MADKKISPKAPEKDTTKSDAAARVTKKTSMKRGKLSHKRGKR